MDIRKYARNLSKALKFSDGDHAAVQAMLDTLHTHHEHRQPGSHTRLGLADALREVGRESEADLAQSEYPVYVHNNQLYHATGHPTDDGHPRSDLNRFLSGYRDAAVFTTTDDEGNPIDHRFSTSELPSDFDSSARHFYHSYNNLFQGTPPQHAGADFWYSRNGHGTGFWDSERDAYTDADGDYTGQILHERAQRAGEHYLQVNENLDPDNQGPVHTLSHYTGGTASWGQRPGINHEHN